ncbi:MAG: glycosyltransferase family 2 protein [Burkholderiales bacterium]
MSEQRVAFSIVLPCYNEADNLPLLLEAYRAVWPGFPAELILVNNGSTDHTADVLDRELRKPEYTFARTVLVPRNQGYGFGVAAGLRTARGQVIGISHADMQCPAADLFAAYDRLTSNAAPERVFVKGRRAKRPFGPSLITNTMAALATVVLMKPLSDINAQPKVFHRSFLSEIPNPPDGFEFDLYLLYRAQAAGMKVVTIPVDFGARAHGASKWAFSLASRRRHVWATIKFILRLRFASATKHRHERKLICE